MTAEKAQKTPKEKKDPVVRKIAGFDRSAKITVLVKENPKRKNSKSATRFDFYKSGMTIDQALAAGVAAADISYDLDKQYIKIAA